jgi:hypothetical protein
MVGKQRVGLAGNVNTTTEGAGAFKPLKKEAAKGMALATGLSANPPIRHVGASGR